MTRVLVQRSSTSSSSSSNQNRSTSISASGSSSSSALSSASPQQQATGIAQVAPAIKDENFAEEVHEHIFVDELSDCHVVEEKSEEKCKDSSAGNLSFDQHEGGEDENVHDDVVVGFANLVKGFCALPVVKEESDGTVGNSFQIVTGSSFPPPPPVPPPKPCSMNSSPRRFASSDSNAARIGSSRRATGWAGVSNRSSPTGSCPSSPRFHCEGEGYNSADEQGPCFGSSYDDSEREHQFEIDLRRVKCFEVRKMLEDGNCLFRAVADQVYGDSELYDMVRQLCIDYMERERDHFSQFVTEGFTSYCKRKRRDKVYGNNVEIQALSEMYNRPIHIYSYSTEPINIFHGSYNTDTPPIRLSFHHGNHYNSLVDPRRVTVGAGLGFSSLQGANIDKDLVKAAIKARQDQQLDNALIAEGRFYSDLELTEKEIERMLMEASRAEYLADDKFKPQLSLRELSTSGAEPSSSAASEWEVQYRLYYVHPIQHLLVLLAGSSGTDEGRELGSVLNSSMQLMLSVGFSYLQVIEAYSIFGDDVDSMVCYLVETGNGRRRKGKATE